MNLSKSLYTKGIQCPKSLWLKKYKKEVLTPPDASALARFEVGKQVGELACELFPLGRKILFDTDKIGAMIAKTKRWIEEGIETIYEATFLCEGVLVMVDILRVSADGVEIYEVKSSASVKDIYLHDVSIQLYVLKKLGYTIKKSHIIHIDSSYVRGYDLVLSNLFRIVDVSDAVNALQADISSSLSAFRAYLSDTKNEPDIDIGKQCSDPYICDAKTYCWKRQRNIPDYSIFDIFNLGSKKQLELYRQGIVAIEDIPGDFPLTSLQRQKVESWKRHTMIIDAVKIKGFLETLRYPIYYLDFETFQQAIPQWQGVSPYQQIPFQYSLHIEHEDGRLEHKAFLAIDGVDPRDELVERLVKDIPKDVTVLAYNMSFEKEVIRKLALENRPLTNHLMYIHANMKDLMEPFKKQYYVTPEMMGSYSIKYVLPALVPEMAQAYKELEGIQNGGEAMNAYAVMSSMDEKEKEQVRKALLEYCKLDTLAMVKVLEKLREKSYFYNDC